MGKEKSMKGVRAVLSSWVQKIQSGRKEDAGPSSKKEKHEKNARVVGHRTYWALNGSHWWERGILWWRRRRKYQNRCWWHIGQLTSCHWKLFVFTGKGLPVNPIRHCSFQIPITYIYSRLKFHLYGPCKSVLAYIMFQYFCSHWSLGIALSPNVMGFPRSLVGKESVCNAGRHGFNSWVRKIPWRRKWQPTKVFLPEESLGQRSLASYGPWGHKSRTWLSNNNNNNNKNQCHTPYSRFPPEISTKSPLDFWSWPSKGTPRHLWPTVSLMSGCLCHVTPENMLWITPWTYSALKQNTLVLTPGPDSWTSCSFTEFLNTRPGSLGLDPTVSVTSPKSLKLNINKGLWKIGLG